MVLDCYALSNLIKSLFHILAVNKKLNEKKIVICWPCFHATDVTYMNLL